MMDFTFKKYSQIVSAIAKSDYTVLKIADYIKMDVLPEKFVIIRHDVDLDPHYQVRFAELENDIDIHTSYYFRHIDKVFIENVIDRIYKLGHEVGYHYEVFTKAGGDPVLATKLFREEQSVFAEKWQSQTVCPHGGSFVDNTDGYSLLNMVRLIPKLLSGRKVFSDHVNFNLWVKHDFNDFGIIGDAYQSVDFSDILYLSDTGRSWSDRYKRLDKVDSHVNPNFNIRSSDDIISIFRNGEVDKIYLLVHFEQWKDNFADWLGWYAAQIIRRTGKRVLFGTS